MLLIANNDCYTIRMLVSTGSVSSLSGNNVLRSNLVVDFFYPVMQKPSMLFKDILIFLVLGKILHLICGAIGLRPCETFPQYLALSGAVCLVRYLQGREESGAIAVEFELGRCRV